MKPRDLADLILLAALWGASFLFMRVAAPQFGPVPLMELRVLIAAFFLVAIVAWRGELPLLRANLARAGSIGLVNSALPFALFGYGVLTLTAGFASILNATTPMFTAAIGAAFFAQRNRALQWTGPVLGVVGVAVLLWGRIDLKPGSSNWAATLAIAACLAAAASYGLAAHLTRRYQAGVPPLVTAAGTQIGATLALLPPTLALWPAARPSAAHWLAVLVLGVACTGFAYILYFRLISRVGALRAASVTFLIPLFGTFWGALFLGEALTVQMAVGGLIVIAGTVLTLGLVGAPRPAQAAR